MSTSLALFALFSIGSAAAVPCGLNSIVGDPCTKESNDVGKCAGSSAPLACTDVEGFTCTDGAICGQGSLQGRCASNKCKFAVKPCASDSRAVDVCTDAKNAIGTCSDTQQACKTTTASPCTEGNTCTAGGMNGTCTTIDSIKKCQYIPPEIPCVRLDASCADSSGYIGKCVSDGSHSNGAALKCVSTSNLTCTVDGIACEEGTLQGKCSTGQKCKHTPHVKPCAGSGEPCADSHGFIGTCRGDPGAVKCALAETCPKGASCHDGASKLFGMCVHYNKCRYLPPVKPCADTSAADPCADSYGFIGACSGGSCNGKTDLSCAKGVCNYGTGIKKLHGICAVDSVTSKCRYLPPVTPCKSSGSDPCVDGNGFIGTCNGGGACTLKSCAKGASCHDGANALLGTCVETDKCKQLPPPVVIPCYASSSQSTDPCTNAEGLIGTCAGSGTATCTPLDSCGADMPCEKGMLKGMCMSAGNECQHDPLVASCVQAWGTGDGCTASANLIGKCGAWGTGDSITCDLSKCGRDDKTCKAGNLKGVCMEGGNCKYSPPVVPCGLTSAVGDDCTDSEGIIGKCIGPAGSLWCSIVATETCTENNDCDGGTSLNGTCLSGNRCLADAYLKVEYTVQPPGYKNPVAAKVLEHAQFRTQLGNQMERSVETSKTFCSPTPTRANGSFAECTKPGDSCNLVCSATRVNSMLQYKRNGKNDLRCDKDTVQWKGTAGTCEKYCRQDASGFTGLTKKVTGGTITCASYFVGDQCTLKCDPNYRVQTVPTRVCDGNGDLGAWTGNDGVCGHSVDISASVHVVLKDSDSHDLITKLDDDTFNDTFRDSVSKLTGVLPENVVIKKIKLVKTANGRRLNQRSVQVDYSVQVGATDLDSPEDDGRLPVGGGLRGIP